MNVEIEFAQAVDEVNVVLPPTQISFTPVILVGASELVTSTKTDSVGTTLHAPLVTAAR